MEPASDGVTSARAVALVWVCAVAVALTACGTAADHGTRRTPPPNGSPPAERLAVARASCGGASRRMRGAFRVATAHITLRRLTAATGRPRQIDPSAWFPITTGAAQSPRPCRFPLILFSHGAGERPGRYSLLLRRLAAAGFVVLAPRHPDRQDDQRSAAVERPADLAFMLDHLAALAGRLEPGLANEIEHGRVGLAGHSFGGLAAAELAARDRRVGAVLLMAGFGPRSLARRIHVPTLALAGAADTLVPPSTVRELVSALPSGTPHRMVVLPNADHEAYENRCVTERTCAAVERYAVAFFRRRL